MIETLQTNLEELEDQLQHALGAAVIDGETYALLCAETGGDGDKIRKLVAGRPFVRAVSVERGQQSMAWEPFAVGDQLKISLELGHGRAASKHNNAAARDAVYQIVEATGMPFDFEADAAPCGGQVLSWTLPA